jgi:glycosyltransferase involved in cell wall biosynthesis
MLRGEEGNQAREIEKLIAWLKTQPRMDVISLSNVLLIGMVRRLKSELHVPVACALQGEDSFLDALPESHRAACWRTLAERTAEVDLFVAPSRYFGDLMRERLGLAADRVRVVYNGIKLEGYAVEGQKPDGSRQMAEGKENGVPTLGFFARMCPEKGLDTLVEAYALLRQRGRVGQLKLRVGGSCGPADGAFVDSLREQLKAGGLLGEVEFHPNLDRAGKLEFLRSLSVFSAPALYGEAFGLYVIEAMAAGVPVVQPRTAAFPELIEATGGGVLCAAGNAPALAEAVEELLLNPPRARALGEAGRRAVFQRFSAEAMARATLQVYTELAGKAA